MGARQTGKKGPMSIILIDFQPQLSVNKVCVIRLEIGKFKIIELKSYLYMCIYYVDQIGIIT